MSRVARRQASSFVRVIRVEIEDCNQTYIDLRLPTDANQDSVGNGDRPVKSSSNSRMPENHGRRHRNTRTSGFLVVVRGRQDSIQELGCRGGEAMKDSELSIQPQKSRRGLRIVLSVVAVVVIILIAGALTNWFGLAGTPRIQLNGAGSSFAFPLMSAWSTEYKK